ncbi:hypothetical protein CU048_04600 [Beijerinckiaceae bacterium]|nr:hypothetical protein CU048_04600 [Beijerinckiaceae bacterium]
MLQGRNTNEIIRRIDVLSRIAIPFGRGLFHNMMDLVPFLRLADIPLQVLPKRWTDIVIGVSC